MNPDTVSPLDAIDLAYTCPLEVPKDVRPLLARLARNYPHIFPSRDRLAADLGVSMRAIDKQIRKLRDLGIVTSIDVGSHRFRTDRTYRILHLPGLPLTIPPEIGGHPDTEPLRIAETLAGADIQAEPGSLDYPEDLRLVRLFELAHAHRIRLHRPNPSTANGLIDRTPVPY